MLSTFKKLPQLQKKKMAIADIWDITSSVVIWVLLKTLTYHLSACNMWFIHTKIFSVFPFVSTGETLKPFWQVQITPFTPSGSRHASAGYQACCKVHRQVPSQLGCYPSSNSHLVKLINLTPRALSQVFSRRKMSSNEGKSTPPKMHTESKFPKPYMWTVLWSSLVCQ